MPLDPHDPLHPIGPVQPLTPREWLLALGWGLVALTFLVLVFLATLWALRTAGGRA